jgi:hypothetical protein
MIVEHEHRVINAPWLQLTTHVINAHWDRHSELDERRRSSSGVVGFAVIFRGRCGIRR